MSDPVPDLLFEYPRCPICGHEANNDGDSWDCDKCEIVWDRNGERGEHFGVRPQPPNED